jgi:hypothetical protein
MRLSSDVMAGNHVRGVRITMSIAFMGISSSQMCELAPSDTLKFVK